MEKKKHYLFLCSLFPDKPNLSSVQRIDRQHPKTIAKAHHTGKSCYENISKDHHPKEDNPKWIFSQEIATKTSQRMKMFEFFNTCYSLFYTKSLRQQTIYKVKSKTKNLKKTFIPFSIIFAFSSHSPKSFRVMGFAHARNDKENERRHALYASGTLNFQMFLGTLVRYFEDMCSCLKIEFPSAYRLLRQL